MSWRQFSLLKKVVQSNPPIRRGQILLLLEALLQAHQLQLREHGAAAAALLALAARVGPVLQLPAEVQVQRQVVGRRADLQARRGGQQLRAERGTQRAGQRGHGELEQAGLVGFKDWRDRGEDTQTRRGLILDAVAQVMLVVRVGFREALTSL